MKLTSKDLLSFKIIDEIIPEPVGGAHRGKEVILENVRKALTKNLEYFKGMDGNEIINQRKKKFLSIGRFKGFTNSDILSVKKSNYQLIKGRLLKNKSFVIIFLVSILILIFNIL